MGQVAKRGIAFGKIVPIDGLIDPPVLNSIDGFSGLLLKRFGFDSISSKIAAHKPLTLEEIRLLYTDAPMSVLMKLVQLRGSTPVTPALLPLISTSFAEWLEGEVDLRQKARQFSNLHCYVHDLELDEVLSLPKQEIDRLRETYRGVSFVGPAPHTLFEAVGKSRYYFEELLGQLKNIGFVRLLPTHEFDLCRTLFELGFPVEVGTDVSCLPNPEVFAEEFFRLNIQCQAERAEVWEPQVLRSRAEDVGTHFKLLRALALGTLCIRVGRRRASSSFFSTAAFDLVSLFGANEFGFGALDEVIAGQLGVGDYGEFGSRIPEQYLYERKL